MKELPLSCVKMKSKTQTTDIWVFKLKNKGISLSQYLAITDRIVLGREIHFGSIDEGTTSSKVGCFPLLSSLLDHWPQFIPPFSVLF